MASFTDSDPSKHSTLDKPRIWERLGQKYASAFGWLGVGLLGFVVMHLLIEIIEYHNLVRYQVQVLSLSRSAKAKHTALSTVDIVMVERVKARLTVQATRFMNCMGDILDSLCRTLPEPNKLKQRTCRINSATKLPSI